MYVSLRHRPLLVRDVHLGVERGVSTTGAGAQTSVTATTEPVASGAFELRKNATARVEALAALGVVAHVGLARGSTVATGIAAHRFHRLAVGAEGRQRGGRAAHGEHGGDSVRAFGHRRVALAEAREALR